MNRWNLASRLIVSLMLVVTGVTMIWSTTSDTVTLAAADMGRLRGGQPPLPQFGPACHMRPECYLPVQVYCAGKLEMPCPQTIQNVRGADSEGYMCYAVACVYGPATCAQSELGLCRQSKTCKWHAGTSTCITDMVLDTINAPKSCVDDCAP